MMRQTLMLCGLLALLAGCATQELSSTPFYTGSRVKYMEPIEDRVNLWPILYHRAPTASALWPMFSLSDDHWAVRPLYSQYKKHGSGTYNEFNFVWPIGQIDTSRQDYRLFPIFKGNDYFTIFPEFWWTDSAVALLPLIVDRDLDWFSIFPLFYDVRREGRHFNTLFPAWWYDRDDPQECLFWAAAGLAGYSERDGQVKDHWLLPLYVAKPDCFVSPIVGYTETSDWLLPLWVRDDDSFASLPWYQETNGKDELTFGCVPPLLSWYEKSGDKEDLRILLGLAGQRTEHRLIRKDLKTSWCFPFYYANNRNAAFATPLFYTDQDRLATPLFYSDQDRLATPLFYRDGERFITPLYGRTKTDEWLIPFYYRDDEHFITPIAGRSGQTHWCAPLYWCNEDRFVSLPWMSGRIDKESFGFSPLLLSGYGLHKGRHEALALAGLVGRTWTDAGASEAWMFPLFYAGTNSLVTVLFGWDDRSSWLMPLYLRDPEGFISVPLAKRGNRWICPPLLSDIVFDSQGDVERWHALLGLVGHVGRTKSERRENWLLPFFLHDARGDADAVSRQLDRTTLDPAVKIAFELRTPSTPDKHGNRDPRPCPTTKQTGTLATSEWLFGLASDWDHSISGYLTEINSKTNAPRRSNYAYTERIKRGNKLVSNLDYTRRVSFDASTRQKVKDEYRSKRAILAGLIYSAEEEVDTLKKNEKSQKKFLLGIWKREADQGRVTVDSFPFFTYDARPDGYTKTSFIWRFFRYESDSKKGTSADFLFIPLCRP